MRFKGDEDRMSDTPVKKKTYSSMEEWADDFTSHTASAIMQALDQVGVWNKPELRRLVIQGLIGKIICDIGLKVLTNYDNLNTSRDYREKAYKKVMTEFLEFKNILQDDVASGLEEAMFLFTGRDIEYYCQIHVINQPSNKEPC